MADPQGFPNIGAPIADNTGRVQQAWLQFFITLWNRSGGGGGFDPTRILVLIGVLDEDVSAIERVAAAKPLPVPPQVGPVSAITPGASPDTQIANLGGTFVVAGGTVSSIEFSRDGSTFITFPSGVVPVAAGDQVRVTYSVTPTVTFIGS